MSNSTKVQKIDFWKMATGVLLALICGSGITVLSLGMDKVPRIDMIDYVQKNSPWMIDKGEIQTMIKHNTESIKANQEAVKCLRLSIETASKAQMAISTDLKCLIAELKAKTGK